MIATVIAALAVLLVAVSSAHAAKWLPLGDLSPTTAAGSAGGCFLGEQAGVGGPSVATNAVGDTVVAWTQVDGTHTDQQDVVARFRPAGGSFGAPQVIGTTPPCYFLGVFGPMTRAAIDSQGDAVVVWPTVPDPMGANNTVIMASIRRSGEAFGPAKEISDSSQTAGFNDARVVMNGAGTAVAVFTHWNGSNWIVQESTRPPGGDFGIPKSVSASGQDAQSPDVAINGAGAVVAAWVRRDGTTNCGGGACEAAQAAVRPAGASSFASTQTLSGTTENASVPAAAIDPNGRATLVWVRSDDSIIRSLFLNSAGVVDSGTQSLSASGAGADTPDVAVDDNNTAVATWQISSGVIQASARPSGGSFATPAQDISAPGTSGSFLPLPQVVVDPSGNAVVAWSQATNAGNTLMIQAARRPANGSFGAVQNLSADTDYSLIQAIAMDGEGSAIVDWVHLTQTSVDNYTIQSAVFDAGPPTLTGFSVPNTATTGQPAGMSVQASDRWSGASVRWDFGDGTGADGSDVSHAWSAPGVYTITTAATDGAGNSTSTTHTVQVSNAPPPPPPPRITSAINNTWRVKGKSITALALSASNVPAGATITITCTGKPRCRFKKKTVLVKKAGKVNLLKALGRTRKARNKNRRFRAGEKLEIRITKAGWIGKDVLFKLKKGKIPKGTVRCIQLGATKPSAC